MPLRGDLLGEAQRLAEARWVGDGVVGMEGSHDGVRVARGDQRGGEADGGGGATPLRLGDDLPAIEAGKLPRDIIGIGSEGDDVEVVHRHERRDALDCLLHHRARAGQAQELFRMGFGAQGPEACTASPREYRGVHRLRRSQLPSEQGPLARPVTRDASWALGPDITPREAAGSAA